MLDIKVIRSNPEEVKAALNRRNGNYDADIDRLLEIDQKRREVSSSTDAMKAEQNAASKQIPAMKKEGKDASALLARMKELSDQIKECDAEADPSGGGAAEPAAVHSQHAQPRRTRRQGRHRKPGNATLGGAASLWL